MKVSSCRKIFFTILVNGDLDGGGGADEGDEGEDVDLLVRVLVLVFVCLFVFVLVFVFTCLCKAQHQLRELTWRLHLRLLPSHPAWHDDAHIK